MREAEFKVPHDLRDSGTIRSRKVIRLDHSHAEQIEQSLESSVHFLFPHKSSLYSGRISYPAIFFFKRIVKNECLSPILMISALIVLTFIHPNPPPSLADGSHARYWWHILHGVSDEIVAPIPDAWKDRVLCLLATDLSLVSQAR